MNETKMDRDFFSSLVLWFVSIDDRIVIFNVMTERSINRLFYQSIESIDWLIINLIYINRTKTKFCAIQLSIDNNDNNQNNNNNNNKNIFVCNFKWLFFSLSIGEKEEKKNTFLVYQNNS